MSHGLQGKQIAIPPELEPVRAAALRAIGHIRPATDETKAEKDFLFTAKQTKAGDDLPPYYLVYFLLVDLLGFPNLGKAEKIAWSVPIDFHGEAFLIEHRKFGIGVFARASPNAEAKAAEIVSLIRTAVKKAELFFTWLAARTVEGSALNVVNRGRPLFERFEFYLDEYKKKVDETNARVDEPTSETREYKGKKISNYYLPAYKLKLEAGWLGLAVIDAFFSWTEHIFIHVAILKGHLTRGAEVVKLAESNWADKFKKALDLTNAETKKYYDSLAAIRCQFRNFNAHGAFGKQYEAFSFHSNAGAVPVRLTRESERPNFLFGLGDDIPEAKAIEVIESFIDYLWKSDCAPAYKYILESDLPTILTYASDGRYRQAMTSVDAMETLVERLSGRWDQAANMDW
jgi:hypothetical protein